MGPFVPHKGGEKYSETYRSRFISKKFKGWLTLKYEMIKDSYFIYQGQLNILYC